MKIALILVLSVFWNSAYAADEVGFDQVWALYQSHAPSLRAARSDAESAKIARDRAARHFYPHAYATGRAFSTTDPGADFIGTLGQRKIEAADFVPATLNQPGAHFFKQGTLGLELALYEGGMPSAQSEAASLAFEARDWQLKATQVAEYARMASSYSKMLVLIEERHQMISLREMITGIISRYQIGSKSNPVGYSGLLGLKTLVNRVDGLLAQNHAQFSAEQIEISSNAKGLAAHWQPQVQRAQKFLERVFPTESAQKDTPAAVKALQAHAGAFQKIQSAENGRFLPRVGLFAQGDLNSGARATATSFSSGAFLQWDLFTASNLGAADQAGYQAIAADARAEQMAIQMRSQNQASLAGLQAAESNLTLLDQSAQFLEEQTTTARSLFRNGSINALQLVEVLSRRADLLQNRSQVELQVTQLRSALYLTQGASNVGQ